MTMRITGMTSGLDTEAIIGELTKAYKKKTEKYEKSNTKLEWKEDAWKSLNTKIYDLYKNVSNLRFSSAYSTQKSTVSDAGKASVTADGTAANGSQKLKVLSTAQSAYMTGAKLSKKSGDGELTENSFMSDLGYTGEATAFNIVNKDENGREKTTKINIGKNSTIKDVVDQLKKAGLDAKFDQKNSRIFLTSKTTGAVGNFEIETVEDTNNSTANSESIIAALGLNTDSGFYGAKMVNTSDANAEITGGTYLRDIGFDYAENHSFLVTDSEGKTKKEIILNGGSKVENVISQLKEAGLENVELKDGRIVIKGKTPEVTDEFSIREKPSGDNKTGRLLQVLGLGEKAEVKNGAVKLDGTDAKIRLNGATYTSSNNNFSINGLNITTTGVTGDEDKDAITVTTSTDTQAIYDKVKDFLTQYNNLINEMTKLYNADSAKDYEPLTDEEKEEMTDTEIQKWEKKIKDSLLRRDSALDSIMTIMTSTMSKAYDVNGKSYSFSTFGIHTLGFLNAPKNEQNAFHIDGDEDDTNTSGNKDQLMAAIKDDPDAVIGFLKQVTSELYKGIDGKMKSTSLSSAYTVYNDKEITKQKSELAKTIKKWEDKATSQEDYYYKKFAQMEKALTQMQSQTQNITGLFQ